MHIPITLQLLVASLLHLTDSTVYNVMPDNHYHPVNDNTNALQHYLNNTNKYFTSNTQLHFLLGQYYLNNDLILQGVSNFSLIGNRTNEVINTVINCTLPAGIVVVNSSNIVITNIVMNDCRNDYTAILNNYFSESNIVKLTTLLFFRSMLVTCAYLYLNKNKGGIKFINPSINITLSKVIVNYLVVWYDQYTDKTNHTFYINNIQFHDNNVNIYSIQIQQFNLSSNITFIIQHINFTNAQALHILCINCTDHSSTIIRNCKFTSKLKVFERSPVYHPNNFKDNEVQDYDNYDFINANSTALYVSYQDCGNVNMANKLYFINCQFSKNGESNELVQIIQINKLKRFKNLTIIMLSCIFYKNDHVQILSVNCSSSDKHYCILLLIKNTTLSYNTQFERPLVYFYQTKVEINQINIISNTVTGFLEASSSVLMAEDSYLQFSGYNVVSNNTVNVAISSSLVYVQENTVINFTFNTFKYAITGNTYPKDIKRCTIQYMSKRGNLDEEFHRGNRLNYSVVFNNNNMSSFSSFDMKHCSWDSHSAFSTSRPSVVNKKFIVYNYSDDKHKFVCLCYDNKTNCHDEDFGPYYPGQTILLDFLFVKEFRSGTDGVLVNEIRTFDVSCKHDKGKPVVFELQQDKCKRIEYKIMYNYREWCEFSIRILIKKIVPAWVFYRTEMEVYTIFQQPCPKGFSLHLEEYCQCDPILSSYIPSLTHCNIDDQTIPRPANSWISAHTVNNSHSYHVSLHCPYDYCLPHSSHLNLSTPDSQCQFHRSGLLCRQCQQGLSAVFGSSQCKHCSNVYLLLTIPIGIAGLLLVLILFALNLTVTNGNINSFLLSVNIISINISIIFPTTNNSVMRTFILLANLDLGIETCFYDGMNEYAKRWLQLVFPAYLICIAIAIIITSHCSIRVHRLTGRRALPVLATLFLLSYTKVLLNVSSVLFSYSTIIYLPSKHTATVWDVDFSVPLFGIKFIILFITCLIIFLILIFFNVVLIFTKTLSYFRVVTYFKPLLDAYQAPYQKKFYYCTGLQLLIRAIFFGLSALDRDINLMVSIILLGIIICLHKGCPFNKKINNIVELLSLLNLQATFVISYFMSTNDAMINAVILLVMFQLICIKLLHIKVPFCSGNNFTRTKLNNFGKWLAMLIFKTRK